MTKRTFKKTTTADVSVYVSSCGDEVINAAKFEKLVAAKAAEFEADSGRKTEWLEDEEYLSASDILDMTDDERAQLNERWKRAAAEDAREHLLDYDWTEYDIEVEVPVEIEVEFDVGIRAI